MQTKQFKTLATRLFLSITLLIGTSSVQAQTFTTLHHFPALAPYPDYTNSDGALPNEVILSGNTLFGTATQGGTSSYGTIYAVNADGTSFTNLYNFSATIDNGAGVYTNSDGATPIAGLVSLDNTLYGATSEGGEFGQGTLFAINKDGTGFTSLYHFTGQSDGGKPQGSLVLSDSTLYGTTYNGGWGYGTVFSINIDGSGYTILYKLANYPDGGSPNGVIISGDTLYGTTRDGGNYWGTVYSVKTNGADFVVLYAFSGTTGTLGGNGVNSDGARPYGQLTLAGDSVYGTAYYGGTAGNGTVFGVKTNGSGFSTVHNFTAVASSVPRVNADGAHPASGLISSGNTLYGTAQYGGTGSHGTVFSVRTNGTSFTTLHSFTTLTGVPLSNSDGIDPLVGLVLSGNTLYGAASQGGNANKGTVFSIVVPMVCDPAELDIVLINSEAHLTVTGSVGCTYRVDYTTDLNIPVNWVPLVTNTLTSSSFSYVDTSIFSGSRFYQAVLVP